MSEVTLPAIPGATLPQNTLPEVFVYLRYIYNFSIYLAGFFCFLLLVIGGTRYLFSAGNPTKLQRARSQIIRAIVSLIIILCAYLILYTINPQLVLFPEISLQNISSPDIPAVSITEQPVILEEMPLGTLITSEIGVSTFIRFSTSTDPAFDDPEYDGAFDEVISYSSIFQPSPDDRPTKYQGALHGRRLMRINEVASTTLPAFEMLKKLSGEFVELMNEFLSFNEELYQKVLECTCNHCIEPTCSGNGSCDCSSCNTCIEPDPDVCPGRERMEELRNKVLPSYYENPTDPINCEIYLMKYMAEHLRRFLDSNIGIPLVKNDDYKEQSYWYSDEAEELRAKIQACIDASNSWENWIQAPPRGDDFQALFDEIENIIWKNTTTSLASVENKGTVSPITVPPQRDVQTNIEHLSHILELIKYVKHSLNPRYFPSSIFPIFTHTQFHRLKAELQVKEFPWEIAPFHLEPGLRVSDDPATFYRTPLNSVSKKFNPNIAFAQERSSLDKKSPLPEEEIQLACTLISEIPIGKATDEAIKLTEDILRELNNIRNKGHQVIDDILKQEEKATTTTEELVPKFIELTSMEECECSKNCEPGCDCNCEEVCDDEGNCETHCTCECKCEGNACPIDEITRVFGEIQSNIQKINNLFEEIKELIGTPEDVVEENEITDINLTSIYESYFKLNGFYPEEHPNEEERVPIGIDLCCTADDTNCRDELGNLQLDKIEERNYTLIEKLIEVQKLLNRTRDFATFRYLITELVNDFNHLGLAELREIENVKGVQKLGGIWVGGDFSLVNCQQLFIEIEEYYAQEKGYMILEDWMEGRERGHISREMCPVDPPLECDYFDSRIFPKKTPLNCYAYDEAWFEKHLNVASNFFCCVKQH